MTVAIENLWRKSFAKSRGVSGSASKSLKSKLKLQEVSHSFTQDTARVIALFCAAISRARPGPMAAWRPPALSSRATTPPSSGYIAIPPARAVTNSSYLPMSVLKASQTLAASEGGSAWNRIVILLSTLFVASAGQIRVDVILIFASAGGVAFGFSE